jgi:1,2-phenylacetyl-CoA epoxidase PaaB subunit
MISRRLLPVAVRLAANARVRGPETVRMWAITDSALLAARPPPRSTRRLNRMRPAREEHR